MLGFRLPVTVLYDWRTVLLSLVVSIIGSGAALFIVSHPKMKWPRGLAGAVMGGVGISGLHFTTAAYRIVQEALTTVARYAGVEKVEVRIEDRRS